MPRLRYIAENEKTPHTRELIESAKHTGAPDPRVVSLMTRIGYGSVGLPRHQGNGNPAIMPIVPACGARVPAPACDRDQNQVPANC